MSSTTGLRTPRDGIVIVGGGLAGQRCAETLRRHGYSGPIRIVCAEAHLPYDRPPLSKEVLLGSRGRESLNFRPAAWYARHAIDLLPGTSATGLQPHERRLSLVGAAALRYDQLLIATGSRPRTVALLDGYENVSRLHTVDDAAALREALCRRPRLVVVGAGFIGQEVSATARRLGARVTMVEAAACPLERVLGTRLGGWFTEMHQAEGVNVICRATVVHVEGRDRIHRLRLSTGHVLDVDHVVVGVGVEPATAWLAGSGLKAAGGVPVDAHGRSAIDGVFAAGDVAATFDPHVRRHVPGSHWESAARQASRAAAVMLGRDPGTVASSGFWSDQYGLRIHYVGRAGGHDALAIDGDPATRSFTATFTRAGRPVAALLVDRSRALPQLRNLIEKGTGIR